MITNWINKRILRRIDKIRGQNFRCLVRLEVLVDDVDAFVAVVVDDTWISVRSRCLDCINERRIIIKQIADAANTITSGKIKRKIRIALELSRLKFKDNLIGIY